MIKDLQFLLLGEKHNATQYMMNETFLRSLVYHIWYNFNMIIF